MSVITTKSSMLSILKTPNSGQRNSRQRVRFQLPSNISKIFMNYKSNFNSKEYQDLVCTIRDSEISDNDLLLLLQEAKQSVPILNYDLRLFVQALIIIRWTHRGDNVVKCYQEFMNDLVSAHSQHLKVVINQLILLFLNVEPSDWSDGEPVQAQKKQFDNVHTVLKSTMETVPLSSDILLECIQHNFPYFKVPRVRQLSYTYNILKIISYHPQLRSDILQLIIDKLLLSDVNAPRNDIIQAEEEQSDLLYEMEIDEDSSVESHMKHPIADSLDGMMDLLFRFIKNECFEGDRLIQVKCHKLYNELLCIFENCILPTHASHHVQFVIFYICSFERTLAHQFLKYLWTKAISPSVPPIIRQTCIAYLSSFLARADYVQLGYLKNYLSKMSEWIHNYIFNNSEASNIDLDHSHHYIFYSICQALFYLIAFRHEDLVDSRSKLTFLQSLNLSKIVTSKLNPLRTCLPDIVEKFATVTRTHQLAYCYTIIENNTRNSLPVIDKDGRLKMNPIIEMYFPFDPYILQRSNNYIKPLYREYVSNDETANGDMKTKQHSQSPFYREGFSPVNMSTGLSFEN